MRLDGLHADYTPAAVKVKVERVPGKTLKLSIDTTAGDTDIGRPLRHLPGTAAGEKGRTPLLDKARAVNR